MAAAASLLFAVDILASRLANRHVVNADYNFKLHLSKADLGEKRGKRSDRMIHSVFGIYLFETCFLELPKRERKSGCTILDMPVPTQFCWVEEI